MQHHVKQLKSKPLSWSAIASWQFNKEQWARKYLHGIIEEGNAKMNYGKEIGEKLATDPAYLPEVLRYNTFEHYLSGQVSGIPIHGYLDSFDSITHSFNEYKTSSNLNRWNQKSANEHGQLDFYYLLIYLNYKKKPEEINCHLCYIPVQETVDFTTEPFTTKMEVTPGAKVQVFPVKKSMKDILSFAKYLKETYQAMERYALHLSEDRFIITLEP